MLRRRPGSRNEQPASDGGGIRKVSAAHAMIEKNMVAISTFMTFSNPLNPPISTSAPPAIECATAPQDLGIAPFVSVAIPRPRGARQRRADRHRPDDEIEREVDAHPPRELRRPSLDAPSYRWRAATARSLR